MSAGGPLPESRLEDLETRLAFQDDLIDKLNEVIARQDRELMELSRRLKALETRMSDMAEAASLPGGTAGHEVPPHY
jgi:SlyX protein